MLFNLKVLDGGTYALSDDQVGGTYITTERVYIPDLPEAIRTVKLQAQVSEVFIVHVGGTRCVPSSTDNIRKIHACITLTVEFIRTCIFIFLLYV